MAQSEAMRAYQKRYYAENKERIKARVRAWKRANPERVCEHARKDRELHREKRVAATKRWYEANREYALEKAREWAQAHPEKVLLASRKCQNRRRAQMQQLPTEDVDPVKVYIRDEGVCGICTGAVDPSEWELDHIIPLSRGGHHTYENVQVAHATCNRRKGAKLL